MRSSLWAKVAIGVLLLSAGFTLASGLVGQAYAYTHHHHYYSGWYWYYPYYSYYYYPGYGYCYSPYYGYYYGYGCSGYSSYYSQPSQYQLTLSTDPSTLSGAVTGGGSYNQGTSASFSTQNVIQVSGDTRYVFAHWSGDYSGNGVTGTLTMDATKAVTAVYQLQYYLTVSAQPTTAPSPNGSGWFNAGDTATLTIPSQVVGGDGGARLVFDHWNVDGANGQASPTLNLQMNAPHTITGQYKQQYYLMVTSAQGVASGTGWYDAGSMAQISVSTPSDPSYGVSLIFNGWQGGGAEPTNQSTTVLMNAPKTVTATWRTDPTILYATIAVVLVAILLVAGLAFYSYSQRKPVTYTEFCPRCGNPLSPTNSYCPSCGASRRLNVNAGSRSQTPTVHPRRRSATTRHTQNTVAIEEHKDDKTDDTTSGVTPNP
jgi:hypothetical protein